MLQLQLALNLPNLMPFQPKHPAPVHILRVLATVQKLQRLPAADTGGGPLGSLLHCSAQSIPKYLASLGTASAARNRGEAVGNWGGVHAEDKRGGGLIRGKESDWVSVGDDSRASGT